MQKHQYLQEFYLNKLIPNFSLCVCNTIYKFAFSIFPPVHIMIETLHLHAPNEQKVLMTMKRTNSLCLSFFLVSRTVSFSVIVTRLRGKSREAGQKGNPEPRNLWPQGTHCKVPEPLPRVAEIHLTQLCT